MGILFSDKGNVSKKEFKKTKTDLSHKGFDKREQNEVEMVFGGDLDEKMSQKGVSKNELKERIHWLKQNKSKHHLSDQEIKILEDELGKKI